MGRLASVGAYNHYLWESLFLEAVERYNLWAAKSRVRPLEQADALIAHDSLEFAALPWNVEVSDPVAYGRDAIQDVFRRMGLSIDGISDDDMWTQAASRFESWLDAGLAGDGTGTLVVSPFDVAYRHLRWTASGSYVGAPAQARLVFDEGEAFAFASDAGTVDSLAFSANVATLSFDGEKAAWEALTYPDGNVRRSRMAQRLADAVGVGYVANHLSDDELRTLDGAIGDVRRLRGRVPRGRYDVDMLSRYRLAMRRVEAIMMWLESRGIEYSVERDSYPGQVKLVCDVARTRSRASIRVFDTPGFENAETGADGNIRYIGGRVYMDGITVDTADAGGSWRAGRRTGDPTIEEALTNLMLAFGETVTTHEFYDGDDGRRRCVRRSLGRAGRFGFGSLETPPVGWTPVDAASYNPSADGGNVCFTIRRMGFAQRPGAPRDANGRPADATILNESGFPVYDRRETYVTRSRSATVPWNDIDVMRKADPDTFAGETPVYISSVPEQTRATAWLAHTVADAREAFRSEFDVHRLIRSAIDEREGRESEPFTYSAYEDVARMQHLYRDFLVCSLNELPAVSSFSAEDDESDPFAIVGQDDADLRERVVLSHLSALVDARIGSFTPTDGHRFSYAGVCAWSMPVRGDDLHHRLFVLDACRLVGIRGEELIGDDLGDRRARDGLVRFDASHCTLMRDHPSAFVREMGAHVAEALRNAGVMPLRGRVEDHVSMDENGIIAFDGLCVSISKDGRCKLAADKKNHTATAIEGKDWCKVEGHIGQLFVPDENGVIVTRFPEGGSKNYACVPGYEVRLVPASTADTYALSMEERSLLLGHSQRMVSALRQAVLSNVLSAVGAHPAWSSEHPERSRVPARCDAPTCLNGVYRTLYDERLPPDYMKEACVCVNEHGREGGFTEADAREMLKAKIATWRGRCMYGSDVRDGASVFQENSTTRALSANLAAGHVVRRSRGSLRDPARLVGDVPISQIGETSDGYFDPKLTGGGRNQGSQRVLVEGVTVDPVTGKMSRAALDARAPVCQHESMRFGGNVPADRDQMALMAFMHGVAVEHVRMVYMPTNGFNQDDAPVVFKRFCDEGARIIGADGKPRPLAEGDKVCEVSGNKGVIGLVVDPADTRFDYAQHEVDGKLVIDVSGIEDPRDRYLARLVQFGRDNPDVDMIIPPFSPPSRNNAASYCWMTEEASTLHLRDPKTDALVDVAGGVGTSCVIITDKSGDGKTSVYDDPGEGRRASSQYCWAVQSALMRLGGPCGEDSALMRELFGENDASVRNMHEFCLALGVSVDGTGDMSLGAHEDGPRNVVDFVRAGVPRSRKVPVDVGGTSYVVDAVVPAFVDSRRKSIVDVNSTELLNYCGDLIARQGGYLELPFPLDLYADRNVLDRLATAGEDGPDREAWPVSRISTLPVSLAHDGEETDPERLLAMGYERHVSEVTGKPTGAWVLPDGMRPPAGTTFALPLMSSCVRNGVEVEEGSYQKHEFTKSYASIMREATRYDLFSRVLDAGKRLTEIRAQVLEKSPSVKALAESGDVVSVAKMRRALQTECAQLLALVPGNEHEVEKHGREVGALLVDYMLALWGSDPADRESFEQGMVGTLADRKRAGGEVDLRENYRRMMAKSVSAAQHVYDDMCSKIVAQRVNSKHNMMRDGVMCNRISRSSTNIVRPDPRLALDEIEIGADMARRLSIRDGGWALIGRDPELRDAGLAYVKVRVRGDAPGFAMNPSLSKQFDGDFDGDTYSLINIMSASARSEARRYLSVHNRLIDRDLVVDPTSDELRHPLIFQDGMDVQLAMFLDPSLAERKVALEREANETDALFFSGRIDFDEFDRRNRITCERVSAFYRDIYDFPLGMDKQGNVTSVLSFAAPDSVKADMSEQDCKVADAQAHVDSIVDVCHVTGAKPGISKIEAYCSNAGFETHVEDVVFKTRHVLSFDASDLDAITDAARSVGVTLGDSTSRSAGVLSCEVSADDAKKLAGHLVASARLSSENETRERIVVDAVCDHSLFSRERQMGVQKAQAIKSNGTGVAGKYSQRGVMMLRSSCLESVLAMTKPVTQFILQAKHDPEQAARLMDMLMGCMRDLWSGHALSFDEESNSWVASDEPVSAQEWIASAKAFYYDKRGIDTPVDPRHIEAVGRALADEREITARAKNAAFDLVRERVADATDVTCETVMDVCRVRASNTVPVFEAREGRENGLSRVLDGIANGRVPVWSESGWMMRKAPSVDAWVEGVDSFVHGGLSGMLSKQCMEQWGDLLRSTPHVIAAVEARGGAASEFSACVEACEPVFGRAASEVLSHEVASTYHPSECCAPLDVCAYMEYASGHTSFDMLQYIASMRANLFDGSISLDDDIRASVASPNAGFMPVTVRRNRDIEAGIDPYAAREDAAVVEAATRMLADVFDVDPSTFAAREGARMRSLGGSDTREHAGRPRMSAALLHDMTRHGVSVDDVGTSAPSMGR